MWNDPIVEETRRLRDEYAAKHRYNVHSIAEDLRKWEEQGFPMAQDIAKTLQSTVAPSPAQRQNGDRA